MAHEPIDVWDAKTFDPALSALLSENGALVRAYMARDRQIFLSHDLGGNSTLPPRTPTPAPISAWQRPSVEK